MDLMPFDEYAMNMSVFFIDIFIFTFMGYSPRNEYYTLVALALHSIGFSIV